ncbi:hypothetical protein KXV85_005344, partial [Aspergillus fumigatus]
RVLDAGGVDLRRDGGGIDRGGRGHGPRDFGALLAVDRDGAIVVLIPGMGGRGKDSGKGGQGYGRRTGKRHRTPEKHMRKRQAQTGATEAAPWRQSGRTGRFRGGQAARAKAGGAREPAGSAEPRAAETPEPE